MQNTTQKNGATDDTLSSVLASSEDEISVETIEKKSDNLDHTLDHTPVLSEDMQMFSHEHEHDNHHSQKWKHKVKAFFSYFAGGVSIFALSVFGFISGSPSHEDLSANMMKQHNSHTAEEFSSKEDCLAHETEKSHEELEIFCAEKFPDKKNTKNTH